MRTNFSWLLGSATVACAAVGSIVATLWLLGLGPNGTESGALQAGPDSRPAVFRAEALARPHRAVPKQGPPVAPGATHAPVRVQLPDVRSALAPAHVTPSTEAPHVAVRPQVTMGTPVPVPMPARPSVPALPTPVVPVAPTVSTPPATPAPQPTTPEPIPAAPGAQPAALATVQSGPKKATGKDGRSVVPSRKPGSQPSPTAGPVRPTLHDGDHADGGGSEPKLDSSERQAKGDRHDKHKGD